MGDSKMTGDRLPLGVWLDGRNKGKGGFCCARIFVLRGAPLTRASGVNFLDIEIESACGMMTDARYGGLTNGWGFGAYICSWT